MSRYAVSDLHGQLDLYNQIKEFINENDIVYALGDFGDRGPEPWRTLQAVLDDNQFIYLMGNHDYMLSEAIREYLHIESEEGYVNLWYYMWAFDTKIGRLCLNGGRETLEQWRELPNRMDYYSKLKSLPLELRLAALDGKHMIYLTHAGFTPSDAETTATNVDDFVWDRLHYLDKWDNPDGNLLVHGHSPLPHLIKDLERHDKPYILTEGYCIYDDYSKICIDRGAHHTNETVLLDIDTLKGYIFKTGEADDREEN